jgi:hypothetical protein
MRSKIGTKKQWYNPVERPETVGGFGIWETLLKMKGETSAEKRKVNV